MAVLPDDLKVAGGGRLEPSLMFPDETPLQFDSRLQHYIDEGSIAADDLLTALAIDAATKVWAYHRAFDAKYIEMSSTPASVQLNDQGQASFFVTQIQNFKELADAALAEFEALITPEPVPASVATGWNNCQSLRH